jgi:hypothetical protein
MRKSLLLRTMSVKEMGETKAPKEHKPQQSRVIQREMAELIWLSCW